MGMIFLIVNTVIISLTTYIFLRYFVFTRYSRLEPSKLETQFPPFDLKPSSSFSSPVAPDPNNLKSILVSLKVFGILEKDEIDFLDKFLVKRVLKENEICFQDGEFWFVISGSVNVYCGENLTGTNLINFVEAGSVVTSWLNIMEQITQKQAKFDKSPQELNGKLVIRAIEDTVLLELPKVAFKGLVKHHPTAVYKMVQVILTRLQRVTFTILHKYLGLYKDLLQVEKDVNELSSINSLHIGSDNLDSKRLKKRSAEALLFILGLKHKPEHEFCLRKILKDLEIQIYEDDNILVDQDEKFSGMYFVISGKLEAHSSNGTWLFDIQAGGVVGYFSAFIPHNSYTRIKSRGRSIVCRIDKAAVDKVIEYHPQVLLTLAQRLTCKISPMIRNLDMAFTWVNPKAGKMLYRQGDDSKFVYIVLHGRLRGIKTVGDKFDVVGEFGPKDSFGELEVISDSKRSFSIHAVRDSELAALPKFIFDLKYPEIMMSIAKVIASKSFESRTESNIMSSYKTVTLLPMNEFIPIKEVAFRLLNELSELGNALLLDNEKILDILGKNSFNQIGQMQLTTWLADQEEIYDIIIFLVDSPQSLYSMFSITHSDCVLMVTTGNQYHSLSDFESLLLGVRTTARKELVILHASTNGPKDTQKWLQDRDWIAAHHHIQMPMRPHYLFEAAVHPINKFLHNLNPFKRHKYYRGTNDFSRLARRLTGKSIGLCLGGGGAKGLSHIGMIQAFEEAGIQIDIVGGTSIGSFIAALYAHENNSVSMYGRSKVFSQKMDSKLRYLFDLTYPVTSWFTGHAFNRAIWKSFGEVKIEDLWLPYYCVTTNITHSRLETHWSGYVWRYVRASMSLSGFLPPLCDNGDMLLDGGYMNNLPADVMRDIYNVDKIIAIDVAKPDDTSPMDYGDSLSGWWVLLQRFFSKTKIPNLAEIQSRLAYVSNVSKHGEILNMKNVFYVKPPVSHYGVLDFGKFEEIVKIGYTYGKKIVSEWEAQGILKKMVFKKKLKRKRRNSF